MDKFEQQDYIDQLVKSMVTDALGTFFVKIDDFLKIQIQMRVTLEIEKQLEQCGLIDRNMTPTSGLYKSTDASVSD